MDTFDTRIIRKFLEDFKANSSEGFYKLKSSVELFEDL